MYLEEGNFFGYEDLYYNCKRSFSAQTDKEVTVLCKIHKFILESLIEDNSPLEYLTKQGRIRLNLLQEKLNMSEKMDKNNSRVYLSTFYGIKPILK